MEYKTESNKWTNKRNNQTKIHRNRQQYGGYQTEGEWKVEKDKECQIYGNQRFDFGGGHTMQYTGDVSQNCTLETYITNVTPINLIFENILKYLQCSYNNYK